MNTKCIVNGACRLCTVVFLAGAIAGCAISQATPDVEAKLTGAYYVTEQSSKKPIQIASVQVKFVRNETEPSAGLITAEGPSTEDRWTFSKCGTTAGNRIVSIDDRSMLVGLLCRNESGPRFPQIILEASKDGRPIGYSPSPLDFFNHSVNAVTGRMIIVFWGPENMSAFVLTPK
jgi:hypothetical protein